jgi:hypothetical protein
MRSVLQKSIRAADSEQVRNVIKILAPVPIYDLRNRVP